MASGILDFGGALVLVGSVLAAALIILWASIRSFSAGHRVDGNLPYVEEQHAPGDSNGELSTSTDIDRALEHELAEAMETNRPL